MKEYDKDTLKEYDKDTLKEYLKEYDYDTWKEYDTIRLWYLKRIRYDKDTLK